MPECKHYTDAGECAVQHMRGAGGCQGERLHCRFDEGRYCHDFQLARAEAAEEDAKRLAERLGIHIHCPPCESTCDSCKYGQGHEGEASCATAAALAAHEALKEVVPNVSPSDEG